MFQILIVAIIRELKY